MLRNRNSETETDLKAVPVLYKKKKKIIPSVKVTALT